MYGPSKPESERKTFMDFELWKIGNLVIHISVHSGVVLPDERRINRM